jgi:hypothetical protein
MLKKKTITKINQKGGDDVVMCEKDIHNEDNDFAKFIKYFMNHSDFSKIQFNSLLTNKESFYNKKTNYVFLGQTSKAILEKFSGTDSKILEILKGVGNYNSSNTAQLTEIDKGMSLADSKVLIRFNGENLKTYIDKKDNNKTTATPIESTSGSMDPDVLSGSGGASGSIDSKSAPTPDPGSTLGSIDPKSAPPPGIISVDPSGDELEDLSEDEPEDLSDLLLSYPASRSRLSALGSMSKGPTPMQPSSVKSSDLTLEGPAPMQPSSVKSDDTTEIENFKQRYTDASLEDKQKMIDELTENITDITQELAKIDKENPLNSRQITNWKDNLQLYTKQLEITKGSQLDKKYQKNLIGGGKVKSSKKKTPSMTKSGTKKSSKKASKKSSKKMPNIMKGGSKISSKKVLNIIKGGSKKSSKKAKQSKTKKSSKKNTKKNSKIMKGGSKKKSKVSKSSKKKTKKSTKKSSKKIKM